MSNNYPEVLSIAGNDSDGSAGGPADLKAFFARKTYGMLLLTAAVSGNSYGIQDSVLLSNEFIDNQFRSLAQDFSIKSFKTGMLANVDIIKTVARNLKEVNFGFFVLDPVISTKHGNTLLDLNSIDTLKSELIQLSDIITPNFYEAQILVDYKINSKEDMVKAAFDIQKMGAKNVYLKGRHNLKEDSQALDLLLLENKELIWFKEEVIDTQRLNGAGDVLSSIMVSELAKGQSVQEAATIAKKLTYKAIKNNLNIGHKFGPVNIFEIQE